MYVDSHQLASLKHELAQTAWSSQLHTLSYTPMGPRVAAAAFPIKLAMQ